MKRSEAAFPWPMQAVGVTQAQSSRIIYESWQKESQKQIHFGVASLQGKALPLEQSDPKALDSIRRDVHSLSLRPVLRILPGDYVNFRECITDESQ